VNCPVLKPALTRRSGWRSVSIRIPFTRETTPVPLSRKLSEHLVNWYAPVAEFHWKMFPAASSFKQVSKDGPPFDPASCVTVKVILAIERARGGAEPLCAATEYWRFRLREPLLPPVMVIKPSLLTAVQAHPFAVVTPTLPDPPLAGKFWLV